MNVVAKILRGDNVRPTRLHTEAGEYCGLDAVSGIFPAATSWLRQKVTGRYSVQPWWVYAAIDKVKSSLRPTDWVLEVGAGYSTLWLAQRCQSVCSIEESEAWSKIVSTQAHDLRLNNVEILSGESRSFFSDQIVARQWDVVIIDGPRERLEIFRDLLGAAKHPRLVIYDDTDKAENRTALQWLAPDYKSHIYRGFKPQTLHVCETTVFERAIR